MLEEFMALAKVPETAQQCAKIFMELVDKWQTHAKETEQKEALETALMTGREKAEKTIGNAVIAEAAERSINRHVYSMQGEIFPDEYRNAVVTEILRGNSAALYLKTNVEESVRQWFRELENALNEHYSAERLDVLRHEIQSRMRMDAIQRDLEEVLDLLRPKQNLNMSNQDYKDIFEMPLFMHTGNSQVCLQNLFVPQRFTVKSGFDSNESMNEYLARFVRDEKARFLFIEGDAGCGKSSLTAYLSWHYEQHDQIAKDIFGNVQLMTVRLRNIDDLPKNGRPEQRLKRGVLEFLYGQQERNAALEKRFRESGDRVLFLDGYDELCTIEGIENSDAALNRLNELDCKIIVTTRPNYIRYQHFGKGYWHIALEHFDGAQRREWLARYADCGETLGEVNRAYLERIGDNKTAGICDTPMGLYMVAAGHFTPDMLENEWAVYRQIFHNELSETNYNPDSSEAHSIWEYQELLYRVSEEIAWYLYQRNNENLLVPDSEITRIIGELDISEDKRKVIERCFALCGYWKANTNRGCVEFYHNNIRDFFLCEKLMRELNNAYREHGDALHDERGDITLFLRRLCELFQYGKLEKTVLFFIKCRAAYADKEPDLCVDTERKEHHTAHIFETMLLRGDFYSVCAERWETENPVKPIARILGNTVAVYRFLYESFLKTGERIQWWTDVEAVNEDVTFHHLAGQILEYAGSSDLRHVNLRGADLYGVDLHNANLQDALLGNAFLRFAELSGADLQDAELSGAFLYKANLRGANLQDANLQSAQLYNLDDTIGTPIT